MSQITRFIATVFVLIYLISVVVIYYLLIDKTFFALTQPWISIAGDVFFILTQPWSSLIAIFSNLILHTANDGENFIYTAMLLGAIINSIFAVAIIGKIKKKPSEN